MQPAHNSIFEKHKQTKVRTRLTVHVVQHLSPGGIESLVLEILRYSDENNRALVISLEGNRSDAISSWSKLAEFNKQLLFLNKPNGVSFSTVSKLSRLFGVLQPDVVHTHHIGPLIYAGCASRIAKVKCLIHTEHDCWHLDNPKHARMQGLALAICKPRLVADADLVADQLSQKFGYHDLSIIKNGIDCQRFKPASQKLARQKMGLPLSKTLIGCAGRLEHVKGQDVLLKALTMMPDNISLVLAGHGSQLKVLQELAMSLGIERRVFWLGLTDDMPRFYQALDLFCLPSRHEGFPLSTLEAQACDIVSIATNVGAAKETLCPESGVSVCPDNPNALAEAVINTLSRQEAFSPRQFVLNHNDLKQMIQTYHNLAMEAR